MSCFITLGEYSSDRVVRGIHFQDEGLARVRDVQDDIGQKLGLQVLEGLTHLRRPHNLAICRRACLQLFRQRTRNASKILHV